MLKAFSILWSSLKMEAVCSPETLVRICESTRRHNPEQDSYPHRGENPGLRH
jgi:hypothetical protein